MTLVVMRADTAVGRPGKRSASRRKERQHHRRHGADQRRCQADHLLGIAADMRFRQPVTHHQADGECWPGSRQRRLRRRQRHSTASPALVQVLALSCSGHYRLIVTGCLPNTILHSGLRRLFRQARIAPLRRRCLAVGAGRWRRHLRPLFGLEPRPAGRRLGRLRTSRRGRSPSCISASSSASPRWARPCRIPAAPIPSPAPRWVRGAASSPACARTSNTC